MASQSRVGSRCVYDTCFLDLTDPPLGARLGFLRPGDRVRVVALPGCPRPAGHWYIETDDGRFAGMVRWQSLKPTEAS